MKAKIRVREDWKPLLHVDEENDYVRRNLLSPEARSAIAQYRDRPIPTMNTYVPLPPVEIHRRLEIQLEEFLKKARPHKKEIHVFRAVCDRMNLKATVKNSQIDGMAMGAVLGGIFLGPFGVPVGGIIGGCVDLVMNRKKRVAFSDIIEDLSDEEIEALIEYIKERLSLTGLADDVEIDISLLNDDDMQERIAEAIIDFLCEHKGMKTVRKSSPQ